MELKLEFHNCAHFISSAQWPQGAARQGLDSVDAGELPHAESSMSSTGLEPLLSEAEFSQGLWVEAEGRIELGASINTPQEAV